jgi:hypothetical protein
MSFVSFQFCNHTTADGLIPGVLYGNDKYRKILKLMFTIPKKELMRELRKHKSSFENIVYEVVVRTPLPSEKGASASTVAEEGGDALQESEVVYKVLATPRQVQFNPSKY